MQELSRQPVTEKRSSYTFSLIAAMTPVEVVSAQLIDGSVDWVVFENFLYSTLNSLRRDARYKDATIVVLADNASVHKHSTTYDMVKRFGGVLLFNS